MMPLPTLVAFLVFCQALGAVVGASTAVWSELSYVRVMWGGKVSGAERAHLAVIGHGLRYGMTLLLLASLGLIIVAFLGHDAPQPALSSSYWTFMMLALLIITVSSRLARRRVSFHLASATLFTAWWFMVYLSFGWLPLSFGVAVASFVIAAGIFYGLFYLTRFLAVP